MSSTFVELIFFQTQTLKPRRLANVTSNVPIADSLFTKLLNTIRSR